MVLVILTGAMFHPSSTDEITMISYKDIPNRVQIVGKLGRPLGELVKVRGRWKEGDKSKPSGPVFVVEELDENVLTSPVEFSSDKVTPVLRRPNDPTPVVGKVWEFRGVETGRLVGFSEEVWKEVGTRPAQAYGFLTELCYISVRQSPQEP
jgi:hypothetical protein